MLSFGEEAEEEENQLASVKTKIKSSHDVLNDPRLLKGEDLSKELVRVLPPLLYGPISCRNISCSCIGPFSIRAYPSMFKTIFSLGFH